MPTMAPAWERAIKPVGQVWWLRSFTCSEALDSKTLLETGLTGPFGASCFSRANWGALFDLFVVFPLRARSRLNAALMSARCVNA